MDDSGETTRLLQAEEPGPRRSWYIEPEEIPWGQIILVSVQYFAQGLAAQVIFPFVNHMLLEIGVVDDPDQVGYYSGVIETVFFAVVCVLVMPVSRLSDRVGRKFVVIGGSLIAALSTTLFGFGKSFSFLLFARALGGVSRACRTTIRTIAVELVEREQQAVVISSLSLSFRASIAVGQPIGGFLAHPEDLFPELFGGTFWQKHPYSLPCLVVSVFAVLAAVHSYFNLLETSPFKPPHRHLPIAPVDEFEESDLDQLTEDISYKKILSPNMVSNLLNVTVMALLAQGIAILNPLYAFTPISSGGLGFDTSSTGLYLTGHAIFDIILTISFPYLRRRFGTLQLYRICMFLWPLLTVLLPSLNLLKQSHLGDGLMFYTTLLASYVVWSVALLSWSGGTILIVDWSPSAKALATVIGISQFVTSFSQAVAPVIFNPLFALSVSRGIAGGYLVWIVLFLMATVAALHSLTLREAPYDWRRRS